MFNPVGLAMPIPGLLELAHLAASSPAVMMNRANRAAVDPTIDAVIESIKVPPLPACDNTRPLNGPKKTSHEP